MTNWTTPCLRLPLLLALLHPLYALAPVACPAGAPLGRFDLTVSQPGGGPARPLQSINRLLPGYKIAYKPGDINGPDKKKARIALLLVPSEGSKIIVTDPKPADQPAEWTVPFRAQIASLVWGPNGLDKAKVTHLIAKNDELIGQLADYAAKIQETQTLLAEIAQQQTLDPTENVDAAVAGFAAKYPVGTARLDRTQPTNAQMLTVVNGVNPALSAYDPLAPNPQQRAAQTAGLAAAVAGLFFGNSVALAAGGGAVLVNMHSLLFPNTEFRSALAQSPKPDSPSMALCGNKTASASRTELAYLWAARIPDAAAPEIDLTKPAPVPIGAKSTVPIEIKDAKDPKLAARADAWKLVSDDGKTILPVTAKVAADAKSLDLDINGSKFKTGKWKLAAAWDWDPLNIKGEIELREFSKFDTAHLTSESQDKLTSAAGLELINLTGSDFEFVRKLAFKKTSDPFAQPAPLPFRLQPDSKLQTELDAKQLTPGDYVFLISQNDNKPHEVPFKVLPPAPEIAGLPLRVNIGADSQTLDLHGTGLDRIEKITTDGAEAKLTADSPENAKLTLRLASAITAGKHLTLNLTVKDQAAPIVLADAISVEGPRPAITALRKSIPGELGIALQPDELPAGGFVSFSMTTANAPTIAAVALACAGSPPLKITNGEASDKGRLRQESQNTLFLSFNPDKVGQPGCIVTATLLTADGSQSDPRPLGAIVRLPKLESFLLTDEKSGDAAYIGALQGLDLETIEKVGWDAQTGIPVDAIPSPVAGDPGKERLRIAVPWPAPAPHAPLYIWLRGETTGRLTSTKL